MIIFRFGPNTFLGQQNIAVLKDKFLAEVDPTGASLAELDGQNLDFSALNNALGSGSLFAKRRMIVVKNIFLHKDKKTLAQFLEFLKTDNQQDAVGNIIIIYDTSLLQKKLGAKLTVQQIAGDKTKPLTKDQDALYKFLSDKFAQYFGPLTDRELNDWLTKLAQKLNCQIDFKAQKILLGLVGDDLWRLNNEINKLAHYALSQQRNLIAPTDVEALVKGEIDEDIFALMDAISIKDRAAALKLLDEQIEAGSNDLYLLTMFQRQFKILLQVRAALDNGASSAQIGQTLKLHPYVLQKALSQTRNFSAAQLKTVLNKLINLDLEFKTGQATIINGLSLLISEL